MLPEAAGLGQHFQDPGHSFSLLSSNKFISVSAKKLMRKKGKDDEQTSEELNSAHRRWQAKCYYKSVILNELYCTCFCHVINILLIELSRSVWENLVLGQDSPIKIFCSVNKS